MSDGLTINEIKESLQSLETAIDEAKREYAEISGRLSVIRETMKEKFGIISLSKAKVMVETLESDTKEEEQKLRESFDALKTKYDW